VNGAENSNAVAVGDGGGIRNVTPEKLESIPVSKKPLQSKPDAGEKRVMPPPVSEIGVA
jgi:hypothetical protein